MTLIVMLPVILVRPYGISTQSSIYTEDSIEYNDLYYKLFGISGNAGTDDFLLFSLIEVVRGTLLMVFVDAILGSVTLYAIAVIFIVDGDATVLDDAMNPTNSYRHNEQIEEYGIYAVAVFGHKLSSIAEVEIDITVVTQT